LPYHKRRQWVRLCIHQLRSNYCFVIASGKVLVILMAEAEAVEPDAANISRVADYALAIIG
jgi:hypothetical protein